VSSQPLLRHSANLSMLYADLPWEERPAAAARAGFTYVESWWPFDSHAPDPAEVDRFCTALERAGVQLVLLNLDAGNPHSGDRGLLSHPQLGPRIWQNLDAILPILQRTGCRIVNALYGNRARGHNETVQDSTALRRLIRIADRVAEVGACVVLETLNRTDSPAFPLTDIEVTASVVRTANELSARHNVGLLVDVYHLVTMGTDPVAALQRFAPLVRHVQFADVPGRGRPGTGLIDFHSVEQALSELGYDGFIGLEYDPSSASHTDPRSSSPPVKGTS
jgi:hydroxypyruvate isomerase